jgi:hypothetical protein
VPRWAGDNIDDPQGPANEETPVQDQDESRRTAALALWRYGHDYLKAAQALCEADRVTCNESQALYHVAAQGVEFALKSFLRARGVSPEELDARIGHSLLDALQEALARGLPTPPVDVVRTVQDIAPHLRSNEFRYLPAEHGAFPDLAPLLAAGVWILSHVAENAVTDYYIYYGKDSVGEKGAMLKRLRADLNLTASKISHAH